MIFAVVFAVSPLLSTQDTPMLSPDLPPLNANLMNGFFETAGPQKPVRTTRPLWVNSITSI